MAPSAYTDPAMRLFIGIPLDEPTRSELSRIVAHFKPMAEDWRWSLPASWHITLQFLGKTTAEQYDAVQSHLRTIRSAPIPIQLGALDLFDRAGVFFAEAAVSPALGALQRKVLAATALCGFSAETRPYHPHITLARFKNGSRGKAANTLQPKSAGQKAFTRFTARTFLLYESFPSPAGSRYEIRTAFPLA